MSSKSSKKPKASKPPAAAGQAEPGDNGRPPIADVPSEDGAQTEPDYLFVGIPFEPESRREGYIGNHIDMRLTPDQADTMHTLWCSLNALDMRRPSRQVNVVANPADAVRWILDTVKLGHGLQIKHAAEASEPRP